MPLLADEGARFRRSHTALANTIVEPFAVALENDHRVHELARLREAALAENHALLTRLSRQSIVESVVGERGGLRGIMERVEQVARTDVHGNFRVALPTGAYTVSTRLTEDSPEATIVPSHVVVRAGAVARLTFKYRPGR